MKKSELYVMVFNILAIVSFAGCFDPEDCPDRFHVPAEILPYHRDYHIGDTITLISKFDRHVHEIKTDRKYDMVNIDWFPNAFIQYLDTIGYNNSKISKYFNLILDKNCDEFLVSFNDHSVIDCKYLYFNDTFSLIYKFIPKRTGNYFLSQKCAIGPNFNEQNFTGKCKHDGYDVIVDMNSGKDGNIDILKSSQDSLYNTWVLGDPKRNFYDRGGFCFRVIP
ncbi:MAG: hypothetical protein IPK88_10850 [Saprospiraceae bacterium]|nr:hypothetical protein [Candidatus Defluviibacterium haderslevense]